MINTPEDRLSILKMIEERKITVSEGAQLLESLGKEDKPVPTPTSTPSTSSNALKGRLMRIMVTNIETGRTKVNVTLPLSLVDWGLRVGAQYSPEIAGFDISALAEAIQETPDGKLIDVQDEEDGEHVEIYVV